MDTFYPHAGLTPGRAAAQCGGEVGSRMNPTAIRKLSELDFRCFLRKKTYRPSGEPFGLRVHRVRVQDKQNHGGLAYQRSQLCLHADGAHI